MERAGEEPLAGSCFPLDQHGRQPGAGTRSREHLASAVLQRRQGRARTQQFSQRVNVHHMAPEQRLWLVTPPGGANGS
jgi:hypothetical protein